MRGIDKTVKTESRLAHRRHRTIVVGEKGSAIGAIIRRFLSFLAVRAEYVSTSSTKHLLLEHSQALRTS